MRATFFRFTVSLLLAFPSSILAVDDAPQPVTPICETAEVCFHTALIPADFTASTHEQIQRKLERLRTVQEQHPGSLWGKRAGLLIGIVLSERDPAEAIRFFKIAQRDWPLLDDYIRLWIGEAMLKTGDASLAATMFESIPEAVPDTVLVTRALFRSGEAWSRAGQCRKAIESLGRAASLNVQDASAPTALLLLAECQLHENRPSDAALMLKQIWVRYPNAPEAREAEARLFAKKHVDGWRPTADDWYARAVSFSILALHTDAVEAFQKFLTMAPHHDVRRTEVKLKMGLSLVRLKQYDHAREVFLSLASGRSKEAADATVWLARVYLRQGAGDQLLALPRSVTTLSLSVEQAATVRLLSGMWLEDQERYEEALVQYRQVADGKSAQRAEALWRVGWLYYRHDRYHDALATFQDVLTGKEEPHITPQVLYWAARAHDRLQDGRAAELYGQLCRQYTFTYYCQLAPSEGKLPQPVSVSTNVSLGSDLQSLNGKSDLARDRRYLKAFELKLLGMDQDAAKELSTLIERYARDQTALIALSALLSETGAHHQALRLARLYFKDPLESGGADMPLSVWSAAYPMAYLSTIRTHAGSAVDPFLAAAIIREESHYDARALSRVGAIGLMQVMPTTAQALAKRLGVPQVTRDDLFDQEINIRFGVRYLEQLLQQYAGNVLYAVAAYNAGPPAVSSWAAKFGSKDPDEFVEMIPYQETRQYVKRVLRSYREYFRLAGVACTAPSLDKAC